MLPRTLSIFMGLAAASLASAANATAITDKALFSSLVVNPTVIGFEGIAPTGGVSQKSQAQLNALYANLGATFSTGGNFQDADRRNGNIPGGAPSDWFCVPCVAGEAFSISFTNAVQPLIDAVGFTAAMPKAGHVSVQVFNGSTLLESGIFDVNPYSSFDTFIGFYGLGPITSITVDPVENVGFGIDNLTFGDPPGDPLPEPMSLAILGVGLATFGALRRRKR